MKQMQIYVSMPSFNISESKDWHRARAQLDAVCVCVCVFKAVFAFQGCCSVIKRRGTKEEGRGKEKGAKPLFSKERRLLVGDAALIRRTVAVDNHDHRGQSVNSNRPVGIFKVCEAGKENVYCCCTKKQEVGPMKTLQ